VSSSSDGTLYTASTTSTPDTFQANPTNTPAPGNNTGAIVGGTLGGIAALGLLALLTWQMM
jgi:predicted lipid-binding transport protein (Tim44 family)